MRFLILFTAALLIAACARTPRAVEPSPTPGGPPQPGGVLIGLTASEIGARFGRPRFQVREGVGTKLQWSQNGCVLDAYLYPPASGQGAGRVAHVDARAPSGADMTVDACLALLAR